MPLSTKQQDKLTAVQKMKELISDQTNSMTDDDLILRQAPYLSANTMILIIGASTYVINLAFGTTVDIDCAFT